MDPRDGTLQLLTQLHRRFKDRQPLHGCVEVQLIPRRATREAVVHVPLQIGRERTAARAGRAMDRTRTADLIPAPPARDEAHQVEDLGQGNLRTDRGEANPSHAGELHAQVTKAIAPGLMIAPRTGRGTEMRRPYWLLRWLVGRVSAAEIPYISPGPDSGHATPPSSPAVARGQLSWLARRLARKRLQLDTSGMSQLQADFKENGRKKARHNHSPRSSARGMARATARFWPCAKPLLTRFAPRDCT